MVPNPYTVLSLLLAQTCSLPASISRLHSSASDCHQPAIPCLTLNEMTHTPGKRQLTWTRLSQSFRNSPPLFGEHLATDLAAFPGDTLNCIPLQHSGDLVLASPSQGTAGGTRALMPLLSTTGHKMHGNRLRSADKRPSTSGLSSQKGIGHLDMRGKKPSVQYFGWKPRKQSMSWSCCILLIWRPGFSEIMKPLFIATAGSGKEPLGWKPEQRKAFKEIKRSWAALQH